MTIIPAIDIIGGRCVRLSQGDYTQCKTYSDDPVAVARRFEDAGFTRLHVVDLDGAKSAAVVNLGVLEKICTLTSLSVDFGGGIKSDADLRRVIEAGADYACVGSIAATDPALAERWLDHYGPDRIIIGADTLGGTLRTHGWQQDGGQTVFDLADRFAGRLRHLMCTDISRDGMLTGPATELYRALATRYPRLGIIASGGVGSVDDLRELSTCGVAGVVVGKAIYEGRITLNQLMNI
ncbi:MAG: 1-(5-phosphoribosyl)-5-[(5-phosphoribosylamino)methylideneamino] imidazole-4-carboxamide isomerase [Rikenellaceae bacterium]|nr:1-(5-phosphoribosyl)-5-[(5-phosphoribosylamino)methylideneamino] imidazole-4-carboxamide isomerase [Rikenellaceae bacterium]MCL2692970.1 1-(5-phosphoribosyl)-5-[(5-phosphoribosylamino)methylideneamino] imidazole-4-carboxamide isomerase [Rikenellaceae bacterium]